VFNENTLTANFSQITVVLIENVTEEWQWHWQDPKQRRTV